MATEQVVEAAADPIAWLAEQTCWPKVLFYDLAAGTYLAGAGAADLFTVDQPCSIEELEAQLAERLSGCAPDLPGWIGGFRFAPHREASVAWAPFGAGWWVLPRFYRRCDGRRTVAGEVSGSGDHSGGEVSAAPTVSPPVSSAAGETASVYRDRVAGAVEEIRATDLEKVVMARAVRREGRVDVAATLQKLAALETHGFAFWLAPEPGYGFFGVTPETLYERDGTTVSSDALAGTAPRDADPARDAAHAAALQADPKSLHEHELVRSAIMKALEPVARTLADAPEPRILSLSRVHHLYTPVSAQLEAPQSLLARLHPTPAVCGTPQARAESTIARLESVDRGFYAGAVGWWRAGGESVGVALRCVQYAGATTTTYLGAGIVEGSAPAAEHAELDSKAKALWESWTELPGDPAH